MAYNLPVSFNLGTGQSGLTLTPALLDSTGAAAAGLTTVSSFEIAGTGSYFFLHSVPDGHVGKIKYTSGGVYKIDILVSPRESENADAKVSTRAAIADYTTARAAKLDNLDQAVSGVPAAVWSVTTRTLSAFSFAVDLSTGAVAAIWNALTSALTTAGSVGKLIVDNLNAAITSRMAAASYTAPPSAQAVSTQVWSEPVPGGFAAGSAGRAVGTVGSATDPWGTSLPGSYPAGSAGAIVGSKLDQAVSTRASGADYTAARAGRLDNLDTLLSSRADGAQYTPARAAKLDNLDRVDVTLSTRSTLTAAQVDATLSAAHGAGSWGTFGGIGGSGSNPVTITLRDDSGAAVIGGRVTVRTQDQASVVAGPMTTGVDGKALFNLDPATYTVVVASSTLFQTLTPQTLVVSGVTSPVYTLTRTSLLVPTSPLTSVVYSDIFKITGQPAAGVSVVFSLPWTKGGEILPQPGILVDVKDQVTVQTDSSGRFSVELVRSSQLLAYGAETAQYRVECDRCALSALFVVPDAPSLDLSSLFPAVP